MWRQLDDLDYHKNLHLAYSCLLLVTGAICIFAGVTLNKIYVDFKLFLPSNLSALDVMLFFVGGLNILATFLCFSGAWKKTTWLMMSLSILLATIFSLELGSGSSGFVFYGYLKRFLRRTMHEHLVKYSSSNQDLLHSWDVIQMQVIIIFSLEYWFQCCGVDSYDDWIHAVNAIPISCCPFWPGTLNATSCNQSSVTLYKVGCLDVFSEFITEKTNDIGKIAVFAATLQIIGLACALIVFNILSYLSVRQRERKKFSYECKTEIFSI